MNHETEHYINTLDNSPNRARIDFTNCRDGWAATFVRCCCCWAEWCILGFFCIVVLHYNFPFAKPFHSNAAAVPRLYYPQCFRIATTM